MYLIVTYQLIKSDQKIIFHHFLALNVSKNGPNDQLWWAITRSFLVRFKILNTVVIGTSRSTRIFTTDIILGFQ